MAKSPPKSIAGNVIRELKADAYGKLLDTAEMKRPILIAQFAKTIKTK